MTPYLSRRVGSKLFNGVRTGPVKSHSSCRKRPPICGLNSCSFSSHNVSFFCVCKIPLKRFIILFLQKIAFCFFCLTILFVLFSRQCWKNLLYYHFANLIISRSYVFPVTPLPSHLPQTMPRFYGLIRWKKSRPFSSWLIWK